MARNTATAGPVPVASSQTQVRGSRQKRERYLLAS